VFWRTFAPDIVIDLIVRGYIILGEAAGPPPPRRALNHSSAREHASFVHETVADLDAIRSFLRSNVFEENDSLSLIAIGVRLGC
jgi:hypothetical protein